MGRGIARQEARWLQSQLGLDDVPDACEMRSMSLLRQLLSVTVGGSCGWMPFSPDWAGVAQPRVANYAGRFLHMGEYRTARGRHASPHELDGAVPLRVFCRGQAPVPRATAVGGGRALPYLLSEVPRIHRDRWRRVGPWVLCCFRRLQLHGWLTLRCLLSIGPSDFPAGVLKERGT
ncbi:hypothetical protein TcBrA4_0080520 [Trypanosoma cruzi]|nr:hypothetical protein TcBrA4_0080520 [Trypanosoma cruzi]